MATLSDLSADLREHARQMPDGLLRQLHQGEAEHRLRHVDNLLRAAESLPAEQHRHVTLRARRLRDAKPNAEYVKEHKRLEGLRDDARQAGNHEIGNAFMEALDRLENQHPQVAGVQEAIMRWDKAHLQDVSKAAGAAAKAAAVQKALDQATASLKQKQADLRKEIRELQESLNRGNR